MNTLEKKYIKTIQDLIKVSPFDLLNKYEDMIFAEKERRKEKNGYPKY
jgi:hypothetical protein